mgnify:CR=1 FL=1
MCGKAAVSHLSWKDVYNWASSLTPPDALPADPGDRPDRVIERRETQATIERAIGRLPDAFRSVIILRDLQGMAYDEIAEALACSIGTVKSRLARARMRVRDDLMVRRDEM